MEREKLYLAVKHIKLVYVCYLQWFTLLSTMLNL